MYPAQSPKVVPDMHSSVAMVTCIASVAMVSCKLNWCDWSVDVFVVSRCNRSVVLCHHSTCGSVSDGSHLKILFCLMASCWQTSS